MFGKKDEHLSTAIQAEFQPDIIAQFGFPGKVTALGYDPVQSLMAVGTDLGILHILGTGAIQADLVPAKPHPITQIRFVKSVYVVTINEANVVTVWALDTRQVWATYNVPTKVTSIWTDVAMDWLFLGLDTGHTNVFDIDRGKISPYRIDDLQKLVNPQQRLSPVLSVQMHPRDPSLILLCFTQVAICFSVTANEIVFYMEYEFSFQQACWHPTGSHVVSSHVNGALVFWDGSKGVQLTHRTVLETPDDKRLQLETPKLVWCSESQPETTYLVIVMGSAIRVINFGATPTVAITSYESMGEFYSAGQSAQAELGTQHTTALQALVLARQPHFGGTHNPSHIVVLLSSGRLVTVTVPNPEVLHLDAAVLPPALAWRASQITCLDIGTMMRNQWIGMMASAPKPVLRGGLSAHQPVRKLQLASVLATGDSEGTIKLFDGTKADSGDHRLIETSIASILPDKVEAVGQVSLAGEVGEMAVASQSGNVYLFTFKRNTHGFSQFTMDERPIQSIAHRAPKGMKEGFLPQWLVKSRVPVYCLKHSGIGFVAVAYEDQRLIIIDRRGPAIIFDDRTKAKVSSMEFGIVALGTDSFSSITLSVGTVNGNVYIYQILPRQQGGYYAQKYGNHLSIGSDPIITLQHIDLGAGKPAAASADVLGRLASGIKINGAILAATSKEAKLISTITSKKVGSKSLDNALGVGFSFLRAGESCCLVTINAKGKIGLYSLPGFGSITSFKSPYTPATNSRVTYTGDIFIPNDAALMSAGFVRAFGTGAEMKEDDIYHQRIKVPARPSISTAHWVAGRTYVRPEDVDQTFGGTKRGKSKRKEALVEKGNYENPPSTAAPSSPSRSKKSWFSSGSKSPKANHPPANQKTWGRMMDEYYTAAENYVNDKLDDGVAAMKTTQSDAKSDMIGGILGRQFGL